jgi:hypothetical protein
LVELYAAKNDFRDLLESIEAFKEKEKGGKGKDEGLERTFLSKENSGE